MIIVPLLSSIITNLRSILLMMILFVLKKIMVLLLSRPKIDKLDQVFSGPFSVDCWIPFSFLISYQVCHLVIIRFDIWWVQRAGSEYYIQFGCYVLVQLRLCKGKEQSFFFFFFLEKKNNVLNEMVSVWLFFFFFMFIAVALPSGNATENCFVMFIHYSKVKCSLCQLLQFHLTLCVQDVLQNAVIEV